MTVKRRILVVDDDVDFVAANKALLEASDYDVMTAHDGNEALSLAQAHRPDLILLDVMMKTDTEGFEVSRKIREIPDIKRIPVILLTGIRRTMNLPFKFEPDEEWLPVSRILEKPVQPEKMLAVIKEALA
jgi:two-component system alkaline phosphatase synthesis response regulator PhoP